MSNFIEDSSALINPEDEVRKLQDLVKKLERQNQILRSKQDANRETESVIISAKTKQDNNTSRYRIIDSNDLSNKKIVEDLNDSSLDDVALLDLDSIDALIEDDDSWLYLSPKKSDCSNACDVSRQQFDKQGGKLGVTSPLSKLDGVVADAHSLNSSTPRQKTPEAWVDASNTSQATSTSSGPVSKSTDNSNLHESPPTTHLSSARLASRDCSNSLAESRSSPQLQTCDRRKTTDDNQSSSSQVQRLPDSAPLVSDTPRSKSASPSADQEEEEEVKATSESSMKPCQPAAVQRLLDDGKMGISAVPDELADVVAVHVLARMQEESLRQSLTPVRKLSGGFSAGRRSDNSYGSGSSSSSSPTSSPYGSQYFVRKTHAAEPHAPHMSTPNLASATSRRSSGQGLQTKPASTPQLRPPSRLRAPSPRRNTDSPLRQSPARQSPVRQSPREGTRRPAGGAIPRISSASKLPSANSRPSGLRKPTSMASRLDESWKDGCY